jgi:hypothetical protein
MRVLILFFLSFSLHAQSISQIQLPSGITDKMKELKIQLGLRLQAIADSNEQTQDMYLRRTRLNINAKYKDKITYYMDIRNDNVNKEDNSEGRFQVGDAYLKINAPTQPFSFKFFRAKVDISRSQTASSARLIYLNRAAVTDFASDFVSESRRATNAQMNGHINKKLHYHFVIGDGLSSDSFVDAKDNESANINSQSFVIGGKLRLSPFKDWEEGKIKEVYYGKGKHFSLGAGLFSNKGIEFENSLGQTAQVNRTLFNTELSFHYYNFNFIAESFLFQGVHRDLADINDIGSSTGSYASAEYYLENYKLAPFCKTRKLGSV